MPYRLAMTPYSNDPYGIRTHVIAVKGRCLNHLTKGPKFPLKEAPRVGLEPTTLRLTAECSTIELSRNNKSTNFYDYSGIRKELQSLFTETSDSLLLLSVPSKPHTKSFIQTLIRSPEPISGISVRPISNSQLRTLLHFHLCPINLIVFKGSWDISS